MKKFLLSLCVAMLSFVGAWAQFYKFTDTAQGRLYTSADESADPADTPKGAVCDKSYYVKSDYTQTDAPTKTEVKTFSTKQYFVLIGENYTSAYGQEYDEDKTYATVSATLLEGDDLNNKLESSLKKVFKENLSDYIFIQVDGQRGPEVHSGDEFDPSKTYIQVNKGSGAEYVIKDYDWPSWANGSYLEEKSVKTFKDEAIGVVFDEVDGAYIAISSNKYVEGHDYYTCEYINLNDDEETAMADNSANFNTKYVVTGLSDPSGIFYYNAGAYTEVENGDEFLGDNKYYVPGSSFTLRTPSELLALSYVYSVTGLVTLQPDGKTLNIICSGDVCDPGDEFSTEGYKFAAKAVNTIYPGEVENSVKQDDIYNDNQEYYTRAQKYTGQDIPTTTKYQLAQSAYVNNGGRYDVVNAGTDINEGTGYFANDNSESAVDDMSENFEEKEVFSAGAVNYVYIWADTYNNLGTKVQAGDLYNPDTQYVISTSGTDYEGGNHSVVEKSALDSYLESLKIVKSDPVLYTIEGTSYVPAAGTVYDEEKTYYSGVSFTTIDNIKENSAYATPVISVNPGATEYFVLNGETYTKVNAGETYDADKTYYIKDGFDYNVIAKATLISDSYMTSATVAENYWQAMANEINAAGYETVVFATKEGDAEKATICNHVTQAMMTTTTANALDYLDVQIDAILPALTETGNGANNATGESHTCGTFLYPDLGMSKSNSSITILLLPEIANPTKTLHGTEVHRHVPWYCCSQFSKLQLVVMPNNATCIEHHAFTNKASITQVILNDGLKVIQHDAFDAVHLNTLNVPESMEYIGTNAFGSGYLHDVYFLGKMAPIVERDAFGSKAYVCNNTSRDASYENHYLATRADYFKDKEDYTCAMLHLRTDLSADERARFTDVSRDYHVFAYYDSGSAVPYVESSNPAAEIDYNDGGLQMKAIFRNGNTSDYTSTITGEGAFKLTTENLAKSGIPGDKGTYVKNTGFYDREVGKQYKWPSQGLYVRSYTVATKSLLWNGETSIAAGINEKKAGMYPTKDIEATSTVAYPELTQNIKGLSFDIDCDGTNDKTWYDGQEYIGIHQFVLVTGDVSPNTTPQEWDFNTIGGVNWWTICVPLDMTVEQVRSTFGEDTQVCKFNKVVRNKEDIIKFYFTDEQCYGKDKLDDIAIEANHAYMIRPSKYEGADTKFVLPRYEVSPQQVPVPTDVTAVLSNEKNATATEYTYRFIGQYNTQADGKPLQMPQYSYYLGRVKNTNPEQHKLFIAGNTTTNWKPFTCVVLPSDPQADYDDFFDPQRNNNNAKGMNSLFGDAEDDTATSIKYEIICGAENADSTIYNINGQRMGNNASRLSKGIYIQNGKKFIVK